MVRTYTTSLTEQALDERINRLRSTPLDDGADTELILVSFCTDRKLRVGYGRGAAEWELSYEGQGRITVKRRMTFVDWLVLLVVLAIYVVLGYLCVCGGGVTVRSVGLFLGLVMVGPVPLYCINVAGPSRTVDRFVRKYLVVSDD